MNLFSYWFGLKHALPACPCLSQGASIFSGLRRYDILGETFNQMEMANYS